MPFLPQHASPQVWTPSKQVTSAVISALLRKQSNKESLLVNPPVLSPLGISGKCSQVNWASTPFSKPTSTKYHSYKSLPYEFNVGNYQPLEITSGLDWLKITYGTLHRRSSRWGPKTHASTQLTWWTFDCSEWSPVGRRPTLPRKDSSQSQYRSLNEWQFLHNMPPHIKSKPLQT